MKSALPAISEKEFQKQVTDFATLRGWRWAHFRPVQNGQGRWRTPVAGHGKGFPDLVLVRGEWLIFVELKTEKGKLTLDQLAWKGALEAVQISAFNVSYRVWRPSYWDEIQKVLI